MDWKQQLSTLLEGEILTLDVRLICIRDTGKWFLKRLRAIVSHAEPAIPGQIRYPSYLFLRGNMNSPDFFQLISDLTTRSSLSPEEVAKLTNEEKLKKFTFQGWEIVCEYVNIYLRGHTQGNSRWGLGEYTLPSWNFDGNLQPDIQDSQEPLIAEGEHYFPRPIDGAAWYLYGKALHSANETPPTIEISIEDDRAYFSGVDIEEGNSLIRCRCRGKLLSQCTIHLYTLSPQIEHKQAESETTFQMQREPEVIYLALTYGDIWLDKRDISLLHRQFGIPRDVNIIAKAEPIISPTLQEEVANMIATQGENMTLEFKSRLMKVRE